MDKFIVITDSYVGDLYMEQGLTMPIATQAWTYKTKPALPTRLLMLCYNGDLFSNDTVMPVAAQVIANDTPYKTPSLKIWIVNSAGIFKDSGYYANAGTLLHDVTAPLATITINAGYPATNTKKVTLTFSVTETETNPVRFRIKNDEEEWGDWHNFTPSMMWYLYDLDGTRGITGEFVDEAGNLRTSNASIVLDRVKPQGSLTIRHHDKWVA